MRSQFEYGQIVLEYELYLVKPEGEERFPLLVWLPDVKENIEENTKALSFLKKECEKRKLHLLVVEWSKANPSPTKAMYKAIQLLVFGVRRNWKMDVCRTYLMGYSEGAAVAWQLLSGYPRMFAATVAIAGYGDPYRVRNAKDVPIWAFHSIDDEIISAAGPIKSDNPPILTGTSYLVQSLRNIGAEVNYTEFTSGGHKIIDRSLTPEVLDWVMVQNRKKIFRTDRIRPGVWKIDDYFMASCYLIEGKEKALLIDTGMGEGNFEELLRQLTRLDISLAITHLHPDHMYHAALFDEIYMHASAAEKFDYLYHQMQKMDLSEFDSLYGVKISSKPFRAAVLGMEDGQSIDLGEECKITVAYLPGHTPYDCVFIDDFHQCVFTGDAIGSGYTVGIPMTEENKTETITKYKSELEGFVSRYGERIAGYSFLGGHFIQENGCDDTIQEDWLNDNSTYFVPLSLQVMKDMIELCNRIIHGECINEKKDKGEYSWSYKSARISGHYYIE